MQSNRGAVVATIFLLTRANVCTAVFLRRRPILPLQTWFLARLLPHNRFIERRVSHVQILVLRPFHRVLVLELEHSDEPSIVASDLTEVGELLHALRDGGVEARHVAQRAHGEEGGDLLAARRGVGRAVVVSAFPQLVVVRHASTLHAAQRRDSNNDSDLKKNLFGFDSVILGTDEPGMEALMNRYSIELAPRRDAPCGYRIPSAQRSVSSNPMLRSHWVVFESGSVLKALVVTEEDQKHSFLISRPIGESAN